MTKKEFLKALEKYLKNLPKKEIEKSLAFYSEIIDDRMEEGAAEEEAVRDLGAPDKIAEEILSDASFASIARGGAERIRSKKGNTFLIVLAVIGFPIWFPLLTAVTVVLFSGAIVLFALWIAFAALLFSLAVSAALGLFGSAAHLFAGELAPGLFLLGAALVTFALSGLLFPPLKKLLAILWRTAGKWLKGIKKLFVNKREA